jgi:hypothetical protein
MDEPTRLRMQEHYQATWRERGWNEPWPEDPNQRALRARALFGLEMVFGTDGCFIDARDKLGAARLSATVEPAAARELLHGLSDLQKAAVLHLIDDVLDCSTHHFLIRLDRCEFGSLLLKHQLTDENGEPDASTEVAINPADSLLEMFQEGLTWKAEFSLGESIGRRKAE